MSAKELNKQLETLIIDHKNKDLSYEKIIDLFDKQPTSTNSKKILELIKKNNVNLLFAAELAKKQS